MVCPTGIEPVTPSLEGWCSIRLSYGQMGYTFDTFTHWGNQKYWSAWRDSNSRHPAPKAGALPGYATRRRGRNIAQTRHLVNSNMLKCAIILNS